MFEHFKGDEEFVKKILDYKTQVLNNECPILTKFLDPHQQDIIKSVIGHDLSVYDDGGFINSENKRLIICPEYYEILKEDFKITILKVEYNRKFGLLEHKDVLGALMHLGINRSCIGDICKDPLSFACMNEYTDYILMNLTKIKKFKIKLIKINEEIEIKREYKHKEFVVTSMRLDKIIDTLYGISRKKASDAIKNGEVKVNYKIIEQSNYLCNNSDIISFRRHGRVKLIITDRKTKSGNTIIKGLFYV